MSFVAANILLPLFLVLRQLAAAGWQGTTATATSALVVLMVSLGSAFVTRIVHEHAFDFFECHPTSFAWPCTIAVLFRFHLSLQLRSQFVVRVS